MQLKAIAQFVPRMTAGRFMAAKITPGAVEAVGMASTAVLTEAQRLVPVRTGQLKGSGQVDVRITPLTVVGEVKFTAAHAGYVEYGTGRAGASSEGRGPYPYTMSWAGMAARPYLRPALDTERAVIKRAFASQIALSLKK